MKYFSKLILAIVVITSVFAACKKLDEKEAVPVYELGKSPVLSTSLATVAPTVADSNNVVASFSWSNPQYSNDSATTKYILQVDSTGKNFAHNQSKTVYGVLSTSLTGRELNSMLLNSGFKLGTAQSVDVRVISSYNNNNERYMSNVVKIMATPFADPAKLVSEKTSVVGTLANAALHSNTFTWSNAFPGYAGAVTYTLQYDSAGKNFVSPFELPVIPASFIRDLNQDTMNMTALNSGIAGGTTGKVEYRVKAVTTSGAIAYSNVINITIQTYIPILRVYLPGSYQTATGNGSDWTPDNAPELIRDQRSAVNNKLYYTYIFLPANTAFKITVGRSWAVNYGGSGGNLVFNSSTNLSVTTAGYYRISVDISTLKYDIRAGRMGFVGGSTGAGWNPPGVFPTYAMGNGGTNLFVGLSNFTLGGGWKMIDNDQWNSGSNTPDETRSYGTSGGDGSSLETNGGNNFTDFASAGRYRVIWDGRDRDNVKYFRSPATEMRLVGDGMNQAGVNDWDPPTSPQMTYGGNGIWTITIALKANKEIKFLAGNAWGAFDYEDNSGGVQTLGTQRPIVWDGNANFKTPATAGTYTVTLNENTQSVTIN